jgi:hypothetical protein
MTFTRERCCAKYSIACRSTPPLNPNGTGAVIFAERGKGKSVDGHIEIKVLG